MTPEQELYFVLCVLTVLEGVHWLPRDALAFLRTMSGYAVRSPGTWMGNRGGGLVFAPPWPPLSELLVTTAPLVAMNRHAVTTLVIPSLHWAGRADRPVKTLSFAELETVESDGRALKLNDEAFLHGLPGLVSSLSDDVATVAETPPARREGAIREHLSRSLDPEPVRARLAEIRDAVFQPAVLAAVHFVLLFLAVPALVWSRGLDTTWLRLLLAILMSGAFLGITLAFAGRRLRKKTPWGLALACVFYPPAAIHGVRRLTREALGAVHPVAMALVVMKPGAQRELFGRILRDLETPRPLPDDVDETTERTATEHAAMFAAVLRERLEREAIETTGLTAPPAPEEGCKTYCPRCHATLLLDEGDCGDCRVPLLPLPAAGSAAA